MKIYIMRHCATNDGPQDSESRTLNDTGEAQAHAMRKFTKLANVNPELIICSDFQRAEDTAKIMQRGDTPIKTTPFLRPDGDGSAGSKAVSNAWKSVLKLAGDAKSVLIVTHGPLVQAMLASIAFNFLDERWTWEHGAMAYVNTGDSKFRWFVTPKLAAHLTGAEEPKDVEDPGPLLTTESLIEALEQTAAHCKELGLGLMLSGPLTVTHYAESAIALAESLDRAHKAAAVDPLIAWLKSATAQRFRKQKIKVLRTVKKFANAWNETNHVPLRMAMQGALDVPDGRFAGRYSTATGLARQHGAAHVREQIAIPVKEAAGDQPDVGPPKRTAKDLERELDATTDKEMGDKIKAAFDPENPLTIAATLEALAKQFEQYSDGIDGQLSRAQTVATTEVSGAYHDGGAAVVKLVPHTRDIEKIWQTEDDPCPTCQANADMGWILADQPFDSGDDTAPAHPNCRCSVDYRSIEPEQAE